MTYYLYDKMPIRYCRSKKVMSTKHHQLIDNMLIGHDSKTQRCDNIKEMIAKDQRHDYDNK